MNKLAQELNGTLEGSVAGRLLSRIGREMFFPKGIVAQTAEANSRATRFNATVGMAMEDGKPIMLSAIGDRVRDLTANEVVSYAPTPGAPDLRDLWKEAMIRKNPGLEGTPTSRPLVTSGLTNGLFQLAELFADPDDPLVLPELFWGNYRLMFATRRQANIVTYPLFGGDGGFNVAGLGAALAGKKKSIVLLNFPNNPTGYSPTVEEAQSIIAAIANHAEAGNDILAICDDAYFGLFHEEGLFSESLFGDLARCHERVLAAKIDGVTKEDFAWGFRIGFLTYAGAGMSEDTLKALETKTMGNIRSTISNSSRIAQSLMAAAHKSDSFESEKQSKRLVLQDRYRKVKSIVETSTPDELRPLPFNSGYFMAFECLNNNADALRLRLLDRGIGTIAIGDKYLRVAYSTVDETDLEELFREIFDAAAGS